MTMGLRSGRGAPPSASAAGRPGRSRTTGLPSSRSPRSPPLPRYCHQHARIGRAAVRLGARAAGPARRLTHDGPSRRSAAADDRTARLAGLGALHGGAALRAAPARTAEGARPQRRAVEGLRLLGDHRAGDRLRQVRLAGDERRHVRQLGRAPRRAGRAAARRDPSRRSA